MNEVGLLRVLDELGVAHVRVRGGNAMVSCPLAPWTHKKGTDEHPSLSIKINDSGPSVYFCFACHRSGTLIGLIQELRTHGVDIPLELVEWVLNEEREDLKKRIQKAMTMYGPGVGKRLTRPNFSVWDEAEFTQFKGRVPRYIINRGFSIDTCRAWELGYDKKQERLVFPVRRSEDRALVGLVGRGIYEKQFPKYKCYWNFDKAHYLYGEHMAEAPAEGDDRPAAKGVIVVEGFFDVLRLWESGWRNAVALMGTYSSIEQTKKLLAYGRPIYIMMDNDQAGEDNRIRMIPVLQGRVPLFCVNGPEGKDPGDMTAAELADCLSKAKIQLGT